MIITVNVDRLEIALDNLGEELVNNLKNDIDSKGVNASGKFKESLRYEVKQDEKTISLEIYGEDYAKFIEHGRKPGGMPPVEAIRTWIKDKGLNLPKGAEFAIAKSIEKKGTRMFQGSGFYDKPITQTLSTERDIIEKVYDLVGDIELLEIQRAL